MPRAASVITPLRTVAAVLLVASACSSEADPPATTSTTSSTTSTASGLESQGTISTSSQPAPQPWDDDLDPPDGVLGPVSTTAVDPETVGIEWTGDRYSIPEGFVWDETVEGGYLRFTKGPVRIDGAGVSLTGVVFDDIDSGNNPTIKPRAGVGSFTLSQFRSVHGRGSAVVDGTAGPGDRSVVSNFEITGFDGDGIKPMAGSTISDGLIVLRAHPESERHYDGIQITGRSDVTLQRLRIRLEGENNVNAAVFVHPHNGMPSDNTTIVDIEVEHAPWAWYPVRVSGGTLTMYDIVGRGPKSDDGRRPAALVLHTGQDGIDWDRVWAGFDDEVRLELDDS